MKCGPLSDVSPATVELITKEAREKHALFRDAEAVGDMAPLVRLAVAAKGGHLCVEDGLYFDFAGQVRELAPKKRAQWKSHIDDSKGTRRRVIWHAHMLRVKDDVGMLVPLVPMGISSVVNGDPTACLLTAVAPFRQWRVNRAMFEAGGSSLPEPRPVYKDARKCVRGGNNL
jgi:hypothetical protein